MTSAVRAFDEPVWALDDVVAKVGGSFQFVRAAVKDIRHVVDGLLADDFSVIAPPLILRRRHDPVYRAVMQIIRDPALTSPVDFDLIDRTELADALGLPEATVAQYPIAWEITIMIRLIDLRRLKDDAPEVERLVSILEAWVDTFKADSTGKQRRRYRMSRVGLEKDFEAWLVGNFEVLSEFGYPDNLGEGLNDLQRQWRCSDRRVADMVCRVTHRCGRLAAGDWLVIENKAVMVGVEALDQIQHYIDCVRKELATNGESVFGLLLADGVTVELQEGLVRSRIDYLSLAALGYRDHLRLLAIELVQVDGDDVNREQNMVLQSPGATMNELPRGSRWP